MSLSFLDASKIVTEPNQFDRRDFTLAASGQTEKLDIFIKACSIQRGYNCTYNVLPFNTLAQYIFQQEHIHKQHIFLLFPWDLVPLLDWRTGINSENLNFDDIIDYADKLLTAISTYQDAQILFITADTPPVTRRQKLIQRIENKILTLLIDNNANILPTNYFSLSSYLSNGCAIASIHLYEVANKISALITHQPFTTKKIIVTDFDNVLWKGIIAEDGLNGIKCDAEGTGYTHYIYQTFLKKLQQEGILIAGVTRNDRHSALSPFYNKLTVLDKDDFVSILASYNAKSSQLESISKALNLALDSFIFIDDNPIEIEEVKTQLPQVTCIPYPHKTEKFKGFLETIHSYLLEDKLTEEDKSRTRQYKLRKKTAEASNKQGANLTEYLATLDMSIAYQKCGNTNYQRALQLINKTNQFNLNGERLTEDRLIRLIENEGTSLVTFSLTDKFGDHGQVCCILIQNYSQISHFVMSCRVFQRRLEYAAIVLLSNLLQTESFKLSYKRTDKNIPLQTFLSENNINKDSDSQIILNVSEFKSKHESCLDLFSYKP